jgi:hypothetical protein
LHPSRERLIRGLVWLAGSYGEGDASSIRMLNVSQARLGSMLSLARQTVAIFRT